MADAFSDTSKQRKLAPHEVPSDHANPSKFFSHFLYKATIVTVFLVFLPLFPSLAPEFINQTLHARSWELLQLIFVGIAVSYGLFSKKNDETEKEYHHGPKQDTAQSYVSKLLQVSSVFDDESETQTVIDENKVQTWSSQYYRGEPVVVVAKESPVVKEEKSSTVTSEITQKPLLLPVRSLKQRVSDTNEVALVDDSGGLVNGSKRFTSNSKKSRNGEIGGLSVGKFEEKAEENVVLRSPIPWRSRSGKMEMKEDGDDLNSLEEPELNRVASSSFRSNRPNPLSPKISSPHKLSPSTSFSSESQAKISEDEARKKNNFSSSLPPVPPPPPPPPRKAVLVKSNSSLTNNMGPTSEKVLRRSGRSVPAEEGGIMNLNSGSESRGRSIMQNGGNNLGRSVRRFRTFSESMDYDTDKIVEKKGTKNISKEDKKEMVEKVLMETSEGDDDDDDDESGLEDHYFDGRKGNGEGPIDHIDNSVVNDGGPIDHIDNSVVNDEGPDVDKKADEFIAKFREQIRLQRIESIRRSTAQRAGRTFR